LKTEQNNLFISSSPAKAIAEDPIKAIELYLVPGIGSSYFRSLVKSMGSPSEVLSASKKSLESVPGIGPQAAEAIVTSDNQKKASELWERLNQVNGRMTSIWDEDYPKNLKEIHDPPVLLFIRGSLPAPNETLIAIVGTRKPTMYGVRQATGLAEGLAQSGIGVVSGMARGIDTASHEGALQAKGRTYAIFGCGIDYIYPPENKSIAQKIEENGALISEFLPGTAPDPGLFPRRNRIISGLCAGVIVVQGGVKSGALITAKLALEQGREVFAVPGNIDEKESSGPHQLIRSGGILVNSAEDVIEELGMTSSGVSAVEVTPESFPQLNPTELEVVQQLSREPVHIDALVQAVRRPVASILADLLNLEMKGWVAQMPGKLFLRSR